MSVKYAYGYIRVSTHDQDDLFAVTYKVDFYLFICYILAKII